MNIQQPLLKAKFVGRPNRFVATARLNGKTEEAHVANSGRLMELLMPENQVYLYRAERNGRRTHFDLSLVKVGPTLVSINSMLPSALFHEAFLKGKLTPFREYNIARREVTFGESRLDLLLTNAHDTCYIETKCSTLVVNGAAMFPDAPTTRGVKHLGALTHAVKAGNRAAVVFIIQRNDATSFIPNWRGDPDFCKTLVSSVKQGVEVYAYACKVTTKRITIEREVEVKLQ